MTEVTRTTRLIDSDTGEYPLYLADLIKKHPNSMFPNVMTEELLLEYGLELVLESSIPQGDKVTEGKPEKREDQNWYRTWIVTSFTEEDEAANLAAAKAQRMADIEQFYIDSIAKGFPYLYEDVVYHVQIRGKDTVNILGLRTWAKEQKEEGVSAPIFKFRVWENVSIMLTPDQMIDVGNQTFANVTGGYDRIWALKDAVRDATTVSELPTIPAELFSLQ